RAHPSACNTCPLKSQCTDSDDGRELIHVQATWPHTEVARFHRGISLLLLLVALVVMAVVGVRHATEADLGVLIGPLALVGVTARRFWPAFRATRAGFD